MRLLLRSGRGEAANSRFNFIRCDIFSALLGSNFYLCSRFEMAQLNTAFFSSAKAGAPMRFGALRRLLQRRLAEGEEFGFDVFC